MIWGYHYFWKHPYKQIFPPSDHQHQLPFISVSKQHRSGDKAKTVVAFREWGFWVAIQLVWSTRCPYTIEQGNSYCGTMRATFVRNVIPRFTPIFCWNPWYLHPPTGPTVRFDTCLKPPRFCEGFTTKNPERTLGEIAEPRDHSTSDQQCRSTTKAHPTPVRFRWVVLLLESQAVCS